MGKTVTAVALTIQKSVSRHETGACQSGFLPQCGEYDARILVHQIQRILLDIHADRLNKIVARYRQIAADDQHLRIEGVDDASQVGAQLLSHLLQDVDTEHVFFADGIQEVLQGNLLILVGYLLREYRGGTFLESLAQFAHDGRARCLGFHAARFAAMTDDAIVIDMHVAYFARESGAAQIEPAVEDDADADAPAHVYEDDILQSFAYALQKFAVGHAARIVVDAEREAHLFGQFFRQRLVQKRKKAESTSRDRIHSSADTHASHFDHLSFDARAVDVVVGEFEQSCQIFRTVLIFDVHPLGLGNYVSTEVADAECITLFSGINAQPIDLDQSALHGLDAETILRLMPNRRYSTLIRLRYLEGHTNEETAHMLGMNLNTFYNKHKLAKEQFKRILRMEESYND